jgi:hypothetical protein
MQKLYSTAKGGRNGGVEVFKMLFRGLEVFLDAVSVIVEDNESI